ncbi:hypothetical protein [Pasteurella multocida]|uniref:hypothetical protein n=1 Tax=Pasteurella multocida TaxID=747 RepID=UPI00397DF836
MQIKSGVYQDVSFAEKWRLCRSEGGKMAKYAVRFYCLVEAVVDAENMEDVMNVCDLNQFDINNVKHQITQIDDVIEVEEL